MATYVHHKPITLAARSKAWTVFARSNAGIMGSNPTQGTDVYILCLFSVCIVLCVGSGLATGWSPVQGILPTVYRVTKLTKRPRPNKWLQSHNNKNNNNNNNVHYKSKAFLCSVGYAFWWWPIVAETCISRLLYSHTKFVELDGPCYSFMYLYSLFIYSSLYFFLPSFFLQGY
jgi:hypothetical protein